MADPTDLTDDDRLIMNNALARIGAGQIYSLSEDTPLAAQTLAVYRDRVDALLGLYEWSFNAKTYRLDALAQVTQNDYIAADRKFMNGWRYGFTLPGTRLGLPRKVLADPRRPDDPLRDFAIEQNNLYADREQVWAQVGVRAAPSVWLPGFRLAATVAVAADLCVPISHDKGLADELLTQAEGNSQEQGRGGLIGKAIAQDRAGSPNKAPLWRDPLTEARLS